MKGKGGGGRPQKFPRGTRYDLEIWDPNWDTPSRLHLAGLAGACALRGLSLYPARGSAGVRRAIRWSAVVLLTSAAFMVGVVLTQYERLLAHLHTDFAHHSCTAPPS